MTHSREGIDRIVKQLRDIRESGEMPELEPIDVASDDDSVRMSVDADGSVRVDMTQMDARTASKHVKEAIEKLLTHYERTDLPIDIDTSALESDFGELTQQFGARMQEMQRTLDAKMSQLRGRVGPTGGPR